MKLSSDAKKHVAAQVAAAFAGKMKELEAEEEAASKELDKFVTRVGEAVEKFKAEVVLPKFVRLISSFGEISKEVDTNKIDFSLAFGWTNECHKYGNVYVGVNYADTVETYAGLNSRHKVAIDAVKSLRSEIESRVSYALYEIEIHGKKDTLETIINQAIELEVEKLAK